MSEYTIKFTQHAESAIQRILQYLAYDLREPKTSAKWLHLFQSETKRLAFMPERIRLVPEEPWNRMGIRRMTVKNYYVYFWIDEVNHKIQILDVIYAKRDQQKLLEAIPFEW